MRGPHGKYLAAFTGEKFRVSCDIPESPIPIPKAPNASSYSPGRNINAADPKGMSETLRIGLAAPEGHPPPAPAPARLMPLGLAKLVLAS